MAPHVSCAYKHMAKYSEVVNKTEGLMVSGCGGEMHGNIKVLIIYYTCKRIVNLEEARNLYITVVEGLISQVNNDPETRPFLNNYPITKNNIEISISFRKKDGNHVDGKGQIAFISCAHGIVYYSTMDSEDRNFRDFHEEPYEVAKSIVMGDENTYDAR
jgi:hypothetical protein